MNKKLIVPLFIATAGIAFWVRTEDSATKEVVKFERTKQVANSQESKSSTVIEVTEGDSEILQTDKIEISASAIKRMEHSTISKEEQLMVAVSQGKLEEVLFLVEKGVDLEAKDRYGNTALLKSIDEGHLEIAKALLDKGANPLVKNESGLSVATAAALQFEVELFKDLVEKGAEVNPLVLGKMNLLMNLSMEGHSDMVKFIAEKKPEDINQQDAFGNTALHYAVQGGHETVVRELLANNAETELRNSDGLTPLEWAEREGYQSITDLIFEKSNK